MGVEEGQQRETTMIGDDLLGKNNCQSYGYSHVGMMDGYWYKYGALLASGRVLSTLSVYYLFSIINPFLL